jgi:hypothetical protein
VALGDARAEQRHNQKQPAPPVGGRGRKEESEMATSIPCDRCGRQWHPHLIDAKDRGDGQFTVLHGPCCYGQGWAPLTTGPIDDLTAKMIAEAMAAHRQATSADVAAPAS